MTVEYKRMQQLRGSTSQWVADNIIPLDGEIAVERGGGDDTRLKLGDGARSFAALPYLIPSPATNALGSINAVTTAPPGGAASGDFWINTGSGNVLAGWGAPAAGLATVPGDQLLRSAAGTWSLIPTGSNLAPYARSADLAATGGAGLIGWIQAGAAAVARTVLDKLRERPQTVRDRGADPGGSIDARAAFVACDAIGPFTVPPGLYLVGSNLTIANRVTFEPGARLVIPTGCTVTFQAGISAQPVQIFNITGSGGVAGLSDAWFEWFADDLKARGAALPTTDARPALNRFAAALNQGADYAVQGGGIARFGPGTWKIDGAAATLFRNVSIHGAGSSQTMFLWQGSATNGFTVSTNRGQCSGFQFGMLVPGTIPTAGIAMNVLARNMTFHDVLINDCFHGWDVPQIAAATAFWHCHVNSALSIGWRFNTQEAHQHDCVVAGTQSWASITTTAGTFGIGDAVSISGATGVITESYGAGKYKIVWTGSRPVVPTAITDTTSSATGTLTANANCHQAGGDLIVATADVSGGGCGLVTLDGDVIGGDWGMQILGSGSPNAISQNPCWIRTSPNFCVDTTFYGAKIDKAYGCQIAGWFSSTQDRDQRGLSVTNSAHIRFNVQIVNNSGIGFYADNTNYFLDLINPDCDGNCHNISTTNVLADISLVGPIIHDILIQGGTMGYPDLFGRTPNLGLYIGNSTMTTGGQASRVRLMGVNCAAGKANINATQVNTTDQRFRVLGCTGLNDA